MKNESIGRSDPADLVAAVGAALGNDLPALVHEVHRRLSADIEQLRTDERLLKLLSASIEGSIESAVQIFQHDIDVYRFDIPPPVVEYACRLAQQGVPVSVLVRAYRLGQDSFLQWSYDVLNAQVKNPHQVAAAAQRMSATTFAYIDRVTEQVLEAYEEERVRWLQQRNAICEARVHELLRGDRVQVASVETTLGYQLIGRWHLGLIVWTAHEEAPETHASGLARITRDLADLLGCSGPRLYLPYDQVTGWAWLPFGRSLPAREQLRSAVKSLGQRLRVAVGEPGEEIDGFRRTHQQARQVQKVMLAGEQDAPVAATFGEVGPIAMLCDDLPATKAWVGEVLGRLALDDESRARMRETLRLFLLTGGSYASAAQQLALHRNTVHYRVRKAEEALGRPIETDRLDIEIALKVCRWLGASVLTGSD